MEEGADFMNLQVKKTLEEAEKAGGREANKKNVVQKVSSGCE